MQFNGSKYSCLILIIVWFENNMFAHSYMISSNIISDLSEHFRFK